MTPEAKMIRKMTVIADTVPEKATENASITVIRCHHMSTL
jgi:hypothetical protein